MLTSYKEDGKRHLGRVVERERAVARDVVVAASAEGVVWRNEHLLQNQFLLLRDFSIREMHILAPAGQLDGGQLRLVVLLEGGRG